MTARASNATARLRRMHDRLVSAYGPQHWWPAQSSFEVIIGAYLTQNTAWTSVERSLERMRSADALSVDGLRRVPLAALQELIRPSGFATRKAPALKAFVALLDSQFNSSLDAMAAMPTEDLRTILLRLPGVGPETADAILLYALGHAIPVADEYLRRIAERHALLATPLRPGRGSYDALTRLTRSAFAADPELNRGRLYNEFHALTVAVGKMYCSRNPNCATCPLAYDPHQSPPKYGLHVAQEKAQEK